MATWLGLGLLAIMLCCFYMAVRAGRRQYQATLSAARAEAASEAVAEAEAAIMQRLSQSVTVVAGNSGSVVQSRDLSALARALGLVDGESGPGVAGDDSHDPGRSLGAVLDGLPARVGVHEGGSVDVCGDGVLRAGWAEGGPRLPLIGAGDRRVIPAGSGLSDDDRALNILRDVIAQDGRFAARSAVATHYGTGTHDDDDDGADHHDDGRTLDYDDGADDDDDFDHPVHQFPY